MSKSACLSENEQNHLARRVGASLASARVNRNLTQERVAELLGIGNQAISRMERGAVMPTIPRLFEFAAVFECGVEELLLAASPRQTDQSSAIARDLAKLRPDDRQLVVEAVKLLSQHFLRSHSEKASRR